VSARERERELEREREGGREGGREGERASLIATHTCRDRERGREGGRERVCGGRESLLGSIAHHATCCA
jgi:hypothetical protein